MGGINWEVEINIYTLIYVKSVTVKNALKSTGKSPQYSVMTCMGEESKQEWICICVTDSSAIHLKLHIAL